jgi:hypothetical protein
MANSTIGVIDNGGLARSLSGVQDQLNSNAHVAATIATDAVSGVKQKVDAAGAAYVSSESLATAYRYAGSAFAMVATPTAVLVIQGSATKTIRVKRVKVGGAATAAGSMPVVLTRRSTAGTLGSAVLTAVVATKLDSTDGAATAVVSTVGTANYGTLGTTAGVVGTGRLNMVALGSAATSGEGAPLVFDFSAPNHRPLVLRCVAEFLTVDFSGAAIPSGGVLDYEIETEEV